MDATLLRDIIERYGVVQPVALRQLTQYLLANAAGLFSVHRYYGALRSQGFPIAKDTAHAFLIHSVWLAAHSERRRMSNPRKIYPADPSLIPVFERSGRPQQGKALETAVLVELLRREAEVGYVRTANGLEVDFLARFPSGEEELIQVCADLGDPATKEREVRALLASAADHPRAHLAIATLTPEAARGVPPEVRVVDAALWLLGSNQAS